MMFSYLYQKLKIGDIIEYSGGIGLESMMTENFFPFMNKPKSNIYLLMIHIPIVKVENKVTQ